MKRTTMSVRTADVVAQAEKARVFSLRDAFAAAPVPAPASASASASASAHTLGAAQSAGRLRLGSATVPLSVGASGGRSTPMPASASASASALSLKFSPPSQTPRTPTNLPAEVLRSLPATNPIVGKRPSAPAPVSAHMTPSTTAAAPAGPAAAVAPTTLPVRKVYAATAEGARADVMRLAAMVDDLQKKLSTAQTKATTAERNAASAAQRATVERNALSQKVHLLQKELAISKDVTEKARIELRAVYNAKTEVDSANATRVEHEVAALQQTKAALLETLTSLHREHDGLKAQTEQLVVQAERKRELARAKAEHAATLEASAAQRVEAVRVAEESDRRRLQQLKAELAGSEEYFTNLKKTSALALVMAATGRGDGAPKPAAATAATAATAFTAPAPLETGWTAKDALRALRACECCAYGVPEALLGAAAAAVAPTAGAPGQSDEPHADADADADADPNPQKSFACAVEQDLLNNFKANLYANSLFPKRKDVASMYPVTANKQGQYGYEGVTEKEHPERCGDAKDKDKNRK